MARQLYPAYTKGLFNERKGRAKYNPDCPGCVWERKRRRRPHVWVVEMRCDDGKWRPCSECTCIRRPARESEMQEGNP
jgi:hypothetical protein